METNPYSIPNPEDDDDEDSDKAKSDKQSLLGKFSLRNPETTESEADEQESENNVIDKIGRSLLEGDKTDSSDIKSEVDRSSTDEDYGEFTLQEEQMINQAIANDHLEHPITDGEPADEVKEFLGQIAEGVEPDQAYRSVQNDLGSREGPDDSDQSPDLDTDTPNELSSPQEPVIAESNTSNEQESSQPDLATETTESTDQNRPLNTTVAVNGPNESHRPPQTNNQSRENPNQAEQHSISPIAAGLSAYLIGRHGNEKRTKELSKKQKRLDKKVKQMEGRITNQEREIQKASKIKQPETRVNTAPSRVQPAKAESRLDLVKPERVERLGKILVGANIKSTKGGHEAAAEVVAPIESPNTTTDELPKIQPTKTEKALNEQVDDYPVADLIIEQPAPLEVKPLDQLAKPSVRINKAATERPKAEQAKQFDQEQIVEREVPNKGLTDQEYKVKSEAKPLNKFIEKLKVPDHKNEVRDVVSADQIKTMPRNDLLRISQSIVVEGANLRSMFESNLFGEQALRRLVAEKLKGKDIRPLLKREILERQKDFERDPKLRDRSGLTSEAGKSAISKLVSADITDSQPVASESNNKTSSTNALKKQPGSDQQSDAKTSPLTTDRSTNYLSYLLFAAIALIILIIVYLLLKH